MGSWFERGRPALFQALTVVCDQIDANLRTELQERDQKLKNELVTEELEILRNRAAEADRLEAENRTLRAKLLRFHKDQRYTESPKQKLQADVPPDGQTANESRSREPPGVPSINQSAVPTPPPTVPSTKDNGEVNWMRECQKWEQKHKKLDENYKRVLEAYHKQKAEIRKLVTYTEQLKSEQGLLGQNDRALPPSLPNAQAKSIPGEQRSKPVSHVVSSEIHEDPDMTSSFASDPGPRVTVHLGETYGFNRYPSSRTASRYNNKEPQNEPQPESASGETTDDDKDSNAVNLPPLPRSIIEIMPIIKAEPSSDSPVMVSERCIRKRKHDAVSAVEEPKASRVKLEDISSDPAVTGEHNSASAQDSMDLDEVGQRLTTPRKPKDLLRLFDGQTTAEALPPFVKPDLRSQWATKSFPQQTALTPKDPNKRPLRTYGMHSANKPRRKGISKGISTLAEDGLAYKRGTNMQPGTDSARTPQARSRLDMLLNIPSPNQNEPAIIRSAPRLRDNHRSPFGELHAPERRALPFDKEGREKSGSKTPASNGQSEKRPALDRSKAASGQPSAKPRESLRSKPPATLRLEDFKINPKLNDGQNYAFSDVVRSKDDRACLQGCTDMNCCGKQFRALALAQRNSSERSQTEDQKLFEEYLGDRISIVWCLSKEEKEDLWLQAKTWQLANQLGKHRHRYSRMRSPPGFWRADFPSTQEIQEEKAEAEQREQKLMQERYREAMRPGGLWLFRDE